MSLVNTLKQMMAKKSSRRDIVAPPVSSLVDLLRNKAAKADVVRQATDALVKAGRFEAPSEEQKPLVTLAPKAPLAPVSIFDGIHKAGPKKRQSPEKTEKVKKLSLQLLQEIGKEANEFSSNSRLGKAFRARGVGESSELDRIVRLPRRPADLGQYEDLTSAYARPGSTWKLWPIQSAILHEAKKSNGLLGPVGVGHGKCVLGDTEVYDVEHGSRRRVDEIGAFCVATMREPFGQILSSSATSFPSGRKMCVELVLAGGAKVGLSSDHPVYTSRGWIEAAALLPGDLVATPRRLPQPLKSPDITDDEVRFIAYMMADGGCTGHAPIFTKMEPSIVDAFIGVVKRLGGSVLDRTSQSRARELVVKGLDHLVDGYGLRALAKHKRLPKQFYGLSDKQAALFLNIFVACDGHVDTRFNLLDIVLASEQLIDDLRFLLLRLGVLGRKSYKKASCAGKHFDAWRLVVSGVDNVSKFFGKVGVLIGREERCCKVLGALNNSIGNTNVDIVPISRPEFLEICAEMGWQSRGGVRRTAGSPRTEAREFLGCTAGQYLGRTKFASFCDKFNYNGKYAWLATSDLFWDRVKSVSTIGEHEVYDLCVPETGSFVANGIVVHNTIASLLVGKHMDARKIVLLVPPQLRVQLLQHDIPRLNKEFFLPLDRLTVIAYSELSSARSADVLEELKPDLIVADECHNLRHRSAARSKRFARYMREHPECRFVGLSGTITRRSLKDFGHLAELALRARSPLPHNFNALNEWAEALDVSNDPMAAGELRKLCTDSEIFRIDTAPDAMTAQPIVREAFRRRLVETPGVVATEEGALGTSLVLKGLDVTVPLEVQAALGDLRNRWVVGEEELVDMLSVVRAGCQLAAGLYYRWVWPNGQKDLEWLEARKLWNQEMREILKLSRKGLDSPLLVTNAVLRGELESEAYQRWAAVKGRFNPTPPTEVVWLSDYLVQHSVAWAKANVTKTAPGIIWYTHVALGEAVAKAGGFPLIGSGEKAAEELASIDVKKTPVIVASQRSHGTGKNLQMFCQNLFTTPMGGGVEWEQTLARTHRPGQLADEVTGDVFVHTDEMKRSFLSALRDARYIESSQGQRQKLLYAEKIDLPEEE